MKNLNKIARSFLRLSVTPASRFVSPLSSRTLHAVCIPLMPFSAQLPTGLSPSSFHALSLPPVSPTRHWEQSLIRTYSWLQLLISTRHQLFPALKTLFWQSHPRLPPSSNLSEFTPLPSPPPTISFPPRQHPPNPFSHILSSSSPATTRPFWFPDFSSCVSHQPERQ